MKRTLFITLFLSIFSFNSTVSADVKVVTSIKPIHSLAAYVMDGVEKPNVIVDGYNSPHGFSLKPSHAKMIEKADLIIWVGEDLEAFLAVSYTHLRAHETGRNGGFPGGG